MIIRQNKITALGMLLLIALPLIFSVGIVVKQKLIQLQRMARFETEKLETIRVKTGKINWIEEGKEIEIDGNLFDVEHYTISGSDIVLTGFYDHKEEKLVKHIEEVEQQKNRSESPFGQLAVKFLFVANYKETLTFSIQNNWQNITGRFPVYTESIASMSYPTVSPPPKNC